MKELWLGKCNIHLYNDCITKCKMIIKIVYSAKQDVICNIFLHVCLKKKILRFNLFGAK